jgi:hypothetical protein
MNRRIYLYILFSLTIGITVGILTVIGQAYLPGNLNSLANLGPVWLLPAFFVSAIGDRVYKSMVAGWLCLTGMVGGVLLVRVYVEPACIYYRTVDAYMVGDRCFGRGNIRHGGVFLASQGA